MADLQKLLCAELKRNLRHAGAPRIPAGGELLWRWFLDLSRTRSYGMAGPNPITYGDILSYRQVMCLPIEPRHVVVLRAMDETYIEAAYAKRQQTPDGAKTLHQVSDHAMTAGMFDAMFG